MVSLEQVGYIGIHKGVGLHRDGRDMTLPTFQGPQIVPTFLKLRATSRALSNAKGYHFDNTFLK